MLRVMFLGDIIGEPGLEMFERFAPKLKKKYKLDAIVVNGEKSGKNGI